MRVILSLVAAVMIMTLDGPASAQSADSDHAAFRQIISSQIDAFRADDADKAYAFAAPSLQQQFSSPAEFMAMVRKSYVPIYAPTRFSFGDVSNELGKPTQRVTVVGPHGRAWLARYGFVKHRAGQWRIAGVHLIEIDKSMAGKHLVQGKPSVQGKQLVAALAPQRGGAKFDVTYDTGTKQLRITQVAGKKPAGKVFELWMIKGDNPPVSLGVVDGGGSSSAPVSAALQSAFAEGVTLAVSVEPVGGSTTGAPTGPVVAMGPVKSG